MKAKVLLAQPASAPSRAQDFGVPHLLSLAGWIERECGVEPVLRDLRHEREPQRALEAAVAEARPVAIGLSCYSSFDYVDALEAARRARAAAPRTPIVVGGYHASARPEDFTRHPELFDFVVVGDGERPLADVVRWALDGGTRPAAVLVADRPVEPAELPPYPFRLLERYRAAAAAGRAKLQVNLSRGCPHACTFCMERAKPDRQWRALPPERAVEELRRLDEMFPVAGRLLHVTDPLFGMKAEWRREFLTRLAASGLRPRAMWTLTRAEGWSGDELRLAAACRLSLGIGLESGSPAMLRLMRKTGRPDAYLEGFLRLRDLAAAAGVSWGVNVLVGHPGETETTMSESLAFLERLFPPKTAARGWLSVDPFRLYPGSEVQRRAAEWTAEHGARFHAPEWWLRAADRDVTSELVDPSASLDAFARLDAAFTRHRATVLRVGDAFRCDDADAAPIFERSIEEQRDAFSLEAYERRRQVYATLHPDVRLPAGPPPPATLAIDRAEGHEALVPVAARALGWRAAARVTLVGPRDRAVEHALQETLGPRASVRWLSADGGGLRKLAARLAGIARRRVAQRPAGMPRFRAGRADSVLLLGAHPAVPRAVRAWLRARAGRRAVVLVGPRFSEQRALLLSSGADGIRARTIAVGRFPAARGSEGWSS